MRSRLFSLIILASVMNCILLNGCNAQSELDKQIIQGFFSYYSNCLNGKLKIIEINKYLHSEDTIHTVRTITFTREVENDLKLAFNVDDYKDNQYYRYSYDGEYIFFQSDRMETLSIYNGDENRVMTSLQMYFKLLPVLNAEDYVERVFRKGKFEVHDKYYVYKRKGLTIFLNKEDYSLAHVTEKAKYNGETQYLDISIKNQDINIKLDDNWFLSDSSFLKGYTIIDHRNEIDKEYGLQKGNRAPLFKAKSIHGDSISLLLHGNNLTVLDFWYIGCFHCKKAISILIEIDDKYDNISIVGINSIDSNITKIDEYLVENKIDYLQISDPELTILKKYKVVRFPTIFLIDKYGIILRVYNGMDDDDKQDLIQTIQDHIN